MPDEGQDKNSSELYINYKQLSYQYNLHKESYNYMGKGFNNSQVRLNSTLKSHSRAPSASRGRDTNRPKNFNESSRLQYSRRS